MKVVRFAVVASAVLAGEVLADTPVFRTALTLQPAPETVYAPPQAPQPRSGVNEGAVHFEGEALYMTDYVFRGIERFEVPGGEDRLNLQLHSKVSIDLDKLPHPFLDLFVNVAENDPISSFQEIRPTIGFDWPIRPLVLSAGHTSYLFPDRDELETNEVFGKISLDDSFLWGTPRPVLSPYIMAAYDYDVYDGLYVEAGVSHRVEFEDTGLSLTFQAAVAYVHGIALFDADPLDGDKAKGFQHYRVGVVGEYSLNELLNLSRRYGEWSITGHLFYNDGIDDDLLADRQLYGGAGVRFRY